MDLRTQLSATTLGGKCCAALSAQALLRATRARAVLRATAALSAPHWVKCGVGHILLVHLHADPGFITRKANIYTRGRNWAYPDRQVQQRCRCIRRRDTMDIAN